MARFLGASRRGRSRIRRNQVPEYLGNERQLFVSVIESSSDFIGIADADGNPFYLNPAGRRLVGLAPDFPVEQTQITDYYPADLRAFARDVIMRTTAARGHWKGETFFRHWQSEANIPVSDEHFSIRAPGSERIIGFATITRDISAARRAADECDRLLTQFRDLIERMPDGVFVHRDGRLIYVNEAMAAMFAGGQRAALIGLAIGDIVHPQDLPGVMERIRSVQQSGLPSPPKEMRLRRTDGSYLYVETAGLQVHFEGHPGIVVIVRDLTERTRAERERQLLADAGAVLGATLDYEQTLTALAELVVRHFADWCVVELTEPNHELRRLKVACRDPAKASVAAELERVRLVSARPRLVSHVLETRRPALIEQLAADEIERFAQGPDHLRALRALDAQSMMAVPLLLRGRLLGALVFISSTPSRPFGPADLALARALADRAAVTIENSRLYLDSVEATRVRDHVLGVVAHDLRNPLAAVLLQAEALKRPGPDPERRSRTASERIERAATRISRLIDDLLDVVQMEGGRLKTEAHPLSTPKVISEAVEQQRPLAATSGIDLQLEVPRDLPDIIADHDRLLQVFENLIGNALKFTQAGGRVIIGAVSRGAEVLFSVADNGPGISDEDQARLFERFWQATRSDRRGTGLGLPICKGIVEAHGGQIWVASALGRGSTFYFTIPSVLARAS